MEVIIINNDIKKVISDICKVNMDDIVLDIPKRKIHGDLTTNIALKSASRLSKSPLELCNIIKRELDNIHIIKKIEVKEPGFINIFIKNSDKLDSYIDNLRDISINEYNNEISLYIELTDKDKITSYRGLVYMQTMGEFLELVGAKVNTYASINKAHGLEDGFSSIKFINSKPPGDIHTLKVGKVVVENAEIQHKFKFEELIDTLGINRLKVDMIYTPIGDKCTIEILDDKLLYLTYPIRRIDILKEWVDREGKEIDYNCLDEEMDEQLFNLIKLMSEYKRVMDEFCRTFDMDVLVSYILDMTRKFYKINNNTQIRILDSKELSRLIMVYDYYKKIFMKFDEVLQLNLNTVYS